jgi:hypothetical protein
MRNISYYQLFREWSGADFPKQLKNDVRIIDGFKIEPIPSIR